MMTSTALRGSKRITLTNNRNDQLPQTLEGEPPPTAPTPRGINAAAGIFTELRRTPQPGRSCTIRTDVAHERVAGLIRTSASAGSGGGPAVPLPDSLQAEGSPGT
jgi:hypothetical protein